MTDVPARRPSRSISFWITLAAFAVGGYLLAEGRLVRGPIVIVAGILIGLLFRPRTRKNLIFAAVIVTFAPLLPILFVFGFDLYVHHRYAETGGYNIWGYRGRIMGRKQAGERRIAVLGGSTAFGYGVKSDESYPSRLEGTLNELEGRAGRGPVTVANLAWNSEGAYSFRFTLEDYDYLNPDLVILYSGYNDISRNNLVFRRQSAIFRQTGYLPILPIVSPSWLRRPDADQSATKGDRVVFRPNLADRSTSQAADLARGIAQSLEREMRRLSSADPGNVRPAANGVDGGRWADYCHWLSDAVRLALDRGRHVVVVTEPYIAGGSTAANGQFDQQSAVHVMLADQFPGERRLHYLNMGRAVDLTDTTLCYDGLHLTAPGNARLANRLASGVQPILAEMARGESATAVLSAAPRLETTDRIPPTLLALGRYEAATEEAGKAVREKAGDKRASDELAEARLRLGQLADARNTLEDQIAKRIDNVWTHQMLYLIAASTDDRVRLEPEVAWAETRPDRFVMLSAQADVAAAGGRYAIARSLRGRAIDEARRRGHVDVAAVILARQAVAELLAGETSRAVDDADAAVAMSRRPGPLWAGTLVHALAGNPDEAAALADAFRSASPSDVLVEKLWMPILLGSIQLGRGDPQSAVNLLEPAVAYERGSYWPRYLRGLSHLNMRHGFSGSLEFSRILAQPVVGPTDIVYVAAERQFARASAMVSGSTVLGRVYGKFFQSWQHADPDLPLVKETRAEYLDLRMSISLPPIPEGVWRQTP
jgi:tetratricopeptide (TPR) repeat protein